MAEAATQAPIRVLVVDEDRVVRELLARELGAAGYEVDTLSSGNGFTEDMVQLIRPDVLLVDPFIGDIPLPAVEELLAKLRRQSDVVLFLIDGGHDAPRLETIAAACSADGLMAKRDLLSDAAAALGDKLAPDAEIVEPASEDELLTADMATSAGEEIQLDQVNPPERRRPPATAPAAAPRPAPRPAPRTAGGRSSHADLLAMIEEEVAERPVARQEVPRAEIQVNLFSRHNFYVGTSGALDTGGIFIATAHLMPIGQQVRLRLDLPFSEALETEGRVEWARTADAYTRTPSGVGVSLAHLHADVRKALEHFFRERAPLTHLPDRM
jgi:Tfp pilus assembly protein PilZ/CheY-like chemotaxis protein